MEEEIDDFFDKDFEDTSFKIPERVKEDLFYNLPPPLDIMGIKKT